MSKLCSAVLTIFLQLGEPGVAQVRKVWSGWTGGGMELAFSPAFSTGKLTGFSQLTYFIYRRGPSMQPSLCGPEGLVHPHLPLTRRGT